MFTQGPTKTLHNNFLPYLCTNRACVRADKFNFDRDHFKRIGNIVRHKRVYGAYSFNRSARFIGRPALFRSASDIADNIRVCSHNGKISVL